MAMKSELLRMEHICKASLGIDVLDDFKLNVFKGEILILIGLSGSGKTMLANILAGRESMDSGSIYFAEQKVVIGSKSISKKLGIYCLHNKSSLVPQLSVAENIFVIKNNSLRKILLNKKAIDNQTKLLLSEIGLDISPDTPAGSLTLAQQHLVEYAKAMASGAKLIVVEDFTGSYTAREIEKLKQVTLHFKNAGISFLIETHRTVEIFEVADRISIMRDGKNVKTLYRDEFNKDYVFNLLVGREFTRRYERISKRTEKEILRVQELTSPELLNKISFNLYQGEILGILDMENKSNMKLADILTGFSQAFSGEIYLDGVRTEIKDLEQAIKYGIGLIPQDGINSQLLQNMSFPDNLSFLLLKKLKKWLLYINQNLVDCLGEEFRAELGIGENQDKIELENFDLYTRLKILFMKWILYKPKVLICIKPCSIADIVMKEIIYSMLDKATERGIAVILISSDLAEVSAICDRVIVLADEKVKVQFAKNDIPKLAIKDLY